MIFLFQRVSKNTKDDENVFALNKKISTSRFSQVSFNYIGETYFSVCVCADRRIYKKLSYGL